MSLVGELLERAARATPAAVEDRSNGWWLRYTDGSAWWSGAVLAHDALSGAGLSERIDAAERFYAEHRARSRFQVCEACPPSLDAMLAARDYRWESPISLMATSGEGLDPPRPSPDLRVRIASAPDEAWLTLLTAGGPQTSGEREADLLRRVRLPSAYATVFAGREPVAIGRAVADDGWTGVFGMATASAARRQALPGWSSRRSRTGPASTALRGSTSRSSGRTPPRSAATRPPGSGGSRPTTTGFGTYAPPRRGAPTGGSSVVSPRSLDVSRRPGTHLAAFSSVALRPGSFVDVPFRLPFGQVRWTHLDDAKRQGTSTTRH